MEQPREPKKISETQRLRMLSGYEEIGKDAAYAVVLGYKPRAWLSKLIKGIYPTYCTSWWIWLAHEELQAEVSKEDKRSKFFKKDFTKQAKEMLNQGHAPENIVKAMKKWSKTSDPGLSLQDFL